jgi:hypothetical protein
MSRFFAYDPNQAHLLPPNVSDVLVFRPIQ